MLKDTEEAHRCKMVMVRQVNANLEAQAKEAIANATLKLTTHIKEAEQVIATKPGPPRSCRR